MLGLELVHLIDSVVAVIVKTWIRNEEFALNYRTSRILVQATINRRLRIGRDGHLDQSEAYDFS